jgi:hypothetical protein
VDAAAASAVHSFTPWRGKASYEGATESFDDSRSDRLGKASFAIGFIVPFFTLALVGYLADGGWRQENGAITDVALIVLLAFALCGVGLGIAGLTVSGAKKSYPVLGILFSSIPFVLVALFLLSWI